MSSNESITSNIKEQTSNIKHHQLLILFSRLHHRGFTYHRGFINSRHLAGPRGGECRLGRGMRRPPQLFLWIAVHVHTLKLPICIENEAMYINFIDFRSILDQGLRICCIYYLLELNILVLRLISSAALGANYASALGANLTTVITTLQHWVLTLVT